MVATVAAMAAMAATVAGMAAMAGMAAAGERTAAHETHRSFGRRLTSHHSSTRLSRPPPSVVIRPAEPEYRVPPMVM